MISNLAVRRSSTDVELRADETAGTVRFSGFATVYDYWYDVAGGPSAGGWREMVAAGAGRKTLNRRPDVRLLINHEGLPLARTTSGTMTLDEEPRGLFVDAPELDMRDPDVQRIYYKMHRDDVNEMSYAFRVNAQEWNGDYTERVIVEYDLAVKGADVSIVTYPANEATVAQLRSEANIDELRAAVSCGLDVRIARHIVDRLRDAAPASA